MITLIDKCNTLIARAGAYPDHPQIKNSANWLKWVMFNLPILVGYPGHQSCAVAAEELAGLLGLSGYEVDALMRLPIRSDGLHIPRSSSSVSLADQSGTPPWDYQPLTSEGSYPDVV